METAYIIGEKLSRSIALLLVLFLLTASSTVISTPVLASAEATENSWITKAPMHTARAYLGVAVVNGKIYAIGGDTGNDIANVDTGTSRTSNVVGTNEEYNPATDTWVLKKSMPTSRAGLGVAVCNNKIYCFGGWKEDFSNTGANEVYDPLTDTWEVKTPLPITAEAIAANVVNGKIYVLQLFTTGAFEVYDPVTDSWASKTPPPYEITGFTSAVIDGKIFFEGALGNTTRGICIQIYDIVSDNWSAVTTLPAASDWFGSGDATLGVETPKRIYFFHETITNIYDPVNDSWNVGASMQTPRLLAGSALVGDTFYVIGGRSGPHGYITIMYPSAVNEQYIPIGYGTIRPVVSVFSPENKTYNVSSVPLTFTVDKPVSWNGYSLDGQENVSITGNTTLTELPYGAHNLTVYAKYTEGSIGASENVAFTIAETEPEPFPTTMVVAASVASLAVVGIGMLVYFKKRKHQSIPPSTISNNK
jgi:N-acetylneuraminic acid mutarotase